MATGTVILVGTIIVTVLGICTDVPESLKSHIIATDAESQLILRKFTNEIHTAFWIILVINGTLGLWILLLGILKFHAANQDAKKEQPALVPVQLAPKMVLEVAPRPEMHLETEKSEVDREVLADEWRK